MNIVLFGPQGCGKGTQADLIVEKYGLYHLSMGDELRKEIKAGSEIGKKVEAIMKRGELVPDEITNGLLLKKSKSPECKKGIILDGYPRRDEQLKFLVEHIKVDAAIEIDVPDEESIERIASRRMCPKCGRNYNLIWLKPKVEGKCDVCKVAIVQRDDDKPAEIRKRLEIYKEQTAPLRTYYQKKKLLHIVDGKRPIAEVAKDIDGILSSLGKAVAAKAMARL